MLMGTIRTNKTLFHGAFQDFVGFPIFAIFSGTALTISTPMFMLLTMTGAQDTLLVVMKVLQYTYIIFCFTFFLSSYCLFGQMITNEDSASKVIELCFGETHHDCLNVHFTDYALEARTLGLLERSLNAFYCILLRESSLVHLAFYETPWLEADLDFRRKVIMGMVHSRKPFILTAKGLASASSETLVDILKTIFSYFNLLAATL